MCISNVRILCDCHALYVDLCLPINLIDALPIPNPLAWCPKCEPDTVHVTY